MVLAGRLEGKRPLGRPKRRWDGNTKMDFQEVGWWNIDYLALVRDRRWAVVNAVMNFRDPQNTGNFLSR